MALRRASRRRGARFWSARPRADVDQMGSRRNRGKGHLSISVNRLAEVRRGDTILVIAPNNASEQLLDRVSDAKDHGGRVLTLHRDDRDLAGLAHEALIVPTTAPPQTFEVVQHLVANTASGPTSRRTRRGKVA